MHAPSRGTTRIDTAPASFGLRLCVAVAYTAISLLLHLAPERR